jgi:Ala-tRNA(Pro) deacylase
MPATKMKEFLDSRGIRYVTTKHSPAFTAQEIAASAHVSGRDFAKTVIVMAGEQMAMVVLPASRRIVLSDLRELLDRPDLRLATEVEFRSTFPDCELGAMPPFGNLYGMPVYVASALAQEPEIAFNAGSHTEIVKMPFTDFDAAVRPIILDFVTSG